MKSGDLIADRYQLAETIGAGGMGVVWRAVDTELRREVAIKLPTAGDTRREARIGAGLQHPNVIAVFDVVTHDDARVLVMEYLPSRTLAQVLRDDGPLAPDAAANIGAQVADALRAMHAKGMVHRDITPHNVLVAEDGTAKLTDLGIAMWSNVTQTGGAYIPGTPGYIAPEVLDGAITTPASDMYGLGMTLAYAVEGEPDGDEPDEERSSLLGLVISALTHPNPKRRPPAARAREMLLEMSPHAGRRRVVPRRLLLVAGALLLIIASVAGVLLWQQPARTSIAQTSFIGDPRTIDPCQLLSKDAVARFGPSSLQRDYGELNRCDLVVLAYPNDSRNDVNVAVKVENSDESSEGSAEQRRRGEAFQVVYSPPGKTWSCARVYTLPEGYRIEAWAITGPDDPAPPVDLCAMADATMTHVISVVHTKGLPRISEDRLPPIARLKACELLSLPDLEKVFGKATVNLGEASYANWGCGWSGSRTVPDGGISLVRDWPVDMKGANYGKLDQIGGHQIAVDDSGDFGDHTCAIRIITRRYTSEEWEGRSDVKTEQIRLTVGTDQPSLPMDQMCDRAKQVAASIIARLPR